MRSKLQKAIATIKDQTSISLAKVCATNLEVAILRATTHKELPAEDHLINQVLLTFATRGRPSTCIHALERRMARTRNWVVALKSLNLIFRILQEGIPRFQQEVLGAVKRGTKVLDLSNFHDTSNSSPWDYTAFVRTFALYLDERLHCTLMGKFFYKASRPGHHNQYHADYLHGELKPTSLLDKIAYWQRLLDRALATQPTGSAKSNRLVQQSLYPVVLESFDLYRNISDGITLLLDSFFHLQSQTRIELYDACSKAAKQFDELAAFYGLCKSLGIGRKVDYPFVQMISERLLETLRRLINDNEASFKINKRMQSGSELLALPAPPFGRSISCDQDFNHELNSKEIKQPSLEEIEQPSLLTKQSVPEYASMDLKEADTMTPVDPDDKFTQDLKLLDFGDQQQQQQLQLPSPQFCLFHQDDNSPPDLVPVGDPFQHQQPPLPSCSEEGRRKASWERVLTEYVEAQSNQMNRKSSALDSSLHKSLYNHNSVYDQHQDYSNPFLQGNCDTNVSPPTFSANPDQNSTLLLEANSSSSADAIPALDLIQVSDVSMEKNPSLHKNCLWMEDQR